MRFLQFPPAAHATQSALTHGNGSPPPRASTPTARGEGRTPHKRGAGPAVPETSLACVVVVEEDGHQEDGDDEAREGQRREGPARGRRLGGGRRRHCCIGAARVLCYR
jgi:hypothetical protein